MRLLYDPKIKRRKTSSFDGAKIKRRKTSSFEDVVKFSVRGLV